MKLCLGTVQFGMDYGAQGAKKPTYKSVEAVLGYALSHGISHMDTAESYGDAESVLGRYISESYIQTEKIRIVSKLSPDAFQHVDRVNWGKVAVEKARDSVTRLSIDRLDAFLFHDASLIYDEYAVDALVQVKDAGLSDQVGVSIYHPNEAMKALEYKGIGVVQVPYNVFDHRLDECGFFDEARDRGIVTYARSTLLQGLAVMDSDHLPQRLEFAKPYLDDFIDICNEYHVTPLEASIGYVNMHKGIDFGLFGVDNVEQLRQYIEIYSRPCQLEVIHVLKDKYRSVEERLVNPTMWK